ncbi:MAG: glycoside hydrolase, partial [Sulfuricaulis sp.]|nr:glycoside hydrolase [Sulfuricaulis sp.]
YQDEAGATANTNPIVLDARGEATVRMTAGLSYKFVLHDADDAALWTVDNIAAPDALDGVVADIAAMSADVRSRPYREIHKGFAFDYATDTIVVRDGTADGLHRHFGQIAEGVDGRLHLIYRRAVEHALTSGATIYHCFSNDGGKTWSAESVLVSGVTNFDQRGMSMCVTPTGRVLVVYDKCPVPSAAPVQLRVVYSDDNGATWTQGSPITSIAYSYARAYGRIKLIPGDASSTYRLAITPYHRSGASTYKVPVWYSADDGVTWQEGGPIIDDATGYNESEMVAVNASIWFAVSRSTGGLMLWKSTDGGAAWAAVGTVPLTSTDNYVAPTLDKLCRDGKWYLLLGYCNRTSGSGDKMTFRVAEVAAAIDSADAFGGKIEIASDMVNASGYHCPITKPDGTVYTEGGTAYVEFKEYDAQDYSRVRFVRIDLFTLAPLAPRTLTVASGAVTVPESSFFDVAFFVDTEGAAATDDLDTITGGVESQIIALESSTSSRDVTLRNGTGNLRLTNDFRLNTAGTAGSRIVLMRCGDAWFELARSNDHVSTATSAPIASGVITVPSSRSVLPILVETEASASTDDLDTISGGLDGQVVILTSASSSRDTTVKDGTGNIQTSGDFTLSNAADAITLIKRGASWYELSRSDNG